MSACWLHLSQWIKKKLPKVSQIKCSKVLMWLSLWCFLLRTPSWSSWPPVRLLLYDSVCRTSEVAKMCYRFEWLRARRAEEVTLLFPLQTFLLSCLLVCAAGPVGTSCFVSRGVKCGPFWLADSLQSQESRASCWFSSYSWCSRPRPPAFGRFTPNPPDTHHEFWLLFVLSRCCDI